MNEMDLSGYGDDYRWGHRRTQDGSINLMGTSCDGNHVEQTNINFTINLNVGDPVNAEKLKELAKVLETVKEVLGQKANVLVNEPTGLSEKEQKKRRLWR